MNNTIIPNSPTYDYANNEVMTTKYNWLIFQKNTSLNLKLVAMTKVEYSQLNKNTKPGNKKLWALNYA